MLEEYWKFGVLTVEGCYVKIFKAYNSYEMIHFGQPVEWAQWQGGSLIVKIKGDDRHLYRATSVHGSKDIIYL